MGNPRYFIGVALLCAGCAGEMTVRRYEIRDITSGRTYICEGRDMHKTAGGVSFRDEATGKMVSLSNVESHRIDDARYKGHFDAWDGIWTTDERIDSSSVPPR